MINKGIKVLTVSVRKSAKWVCIIRSIRSIITRSRVILNAMTDNISSLQVTKGSQCFDYEIIFLSKTDPNRGEKKMDTHVERE